MKAMILAAGLGTRLRPYTARLPKPLITVQGRPLIDHHLMALAEAGVTEVVINVFHMAAHIQDHVGDGARFGVSVTYSDETRTGLLGAYGGVHHALPCLGDAPFLVLSADIYTDFDLATLVHRVPDRAHCVMVPNPSWRPGGDFAVDVAQGRLQPSAEAQGYPRYTYANIGVYQPMLFADKVPGQSSFGPCLEQAMRQHVVTAEVYDGPWFNVGTVEDWRAAAADGDALPGDV